MKHITIPQHWLVCLASPVFFLASCSDKEEEDHNKQTAVTVEATAVRKGDIRTWTFGEGNARATRREYLNFEGAGRITYIKKGLREGSEVKAGEILVHQDQRRLKADLASSKASLDEAKTRSEVAEADLKQARTDHALAQKTYERFAELRRRNSASQQEYDEAKASADKAGAAITRAEAQITSSQAQVVVAEARYKQAEIALEQTELRAPIDGVVARLNVVEGFYMMPSLVRTDSESAFLSTVPVLIIDPSSLEITVDIPPTLKGAVKPGQQVFLRPEGGGENTNPDFNPATLPVQGDVYSVTPSVSPGKRTIQVKIRTTKGAEHVQDGTFVTVWIATAESKGTHIVPQDCIVFRENKPHLFVVDTRSNKSSLRAVTLGLRGIEGQEVKSGVKPGEMVVTRGRYQIGDGSLVSILKPNEK